LATQTIWHDIRLRPDGFKNLINFLWSEADGASLNLTRIHPQLFQ